MIRGALMGKRREGDRPQREKEKLGHSHNCSCHLRAWVAQELVQVGLVGGGGVGLGTSHQMGSEAWDWR